MHLEINQSTDRTEQVTTACIDKLYNLSKSNTLDNTSYLKGTINAPTAYEDAVTYLNTMWGPDLVVTASAYYIRFQDPNVLDVLLNAGIGDGNGISTSDAASANITNTFKNNTNIVSFDEFSYFTSQHARDTSFEGCTNLLRIDVSNCSKLPVFNGGNNLEYYNGSSSVQGTCIIPDGVTEIKASGFKNNYKLTAIHIPSSITTINSNAFEGCTGLQRVDFEGTIDDWLNINFASSTSTPLYHAQSLYVNGSLITSVDFTGKTEIKSYVLSCYQSLTSIVLPPTITRIGNNAFARCTNLVISDLNLPNLTSIGSAAFGTSIENAGTKITTISNLGSITSLPESCFQNCSTLTSVTIPNTVTSIGKRAFHNCVALSSVNIPSTVTKIGLEAFMLCANLTSITIPSGVTSIENRAFMRSGIVDMTVLATTPPTIGSGSISASGHIYVPAGNDPVTGKSYVDIYKEASGWSTYASRISAIPTT